MLQGSQPCVRGACFGWAPGMCLVPGAVPVPVCVSALPQCPCLLSCLGVSVGSTPCSCSPCCAQVHLAPALLSLAAAGHCFSVCAEETLGSGSQSSRCPFPSAAGMADPAPCPGTVSWHQLTSQLLTPASEPLALLQSPSSRLTLPHHGPKAVSFLWSSAASWLN